ncbi:MAG: toxin, partial [Myxococcales bacterium]|nr:toxin [Myxococcales bacterium]
MNPATGTGSMAVPIATSPGRSGFGPQLAVQYDSGSGNGPWGLGWSLSAPSIGRKTDKGLPQYRDPDDSDTFVLSGAEDLVPWLEQTGTTWTKKVETVGTLRRYRYRPRVETDFPRIERVHDTASGNSYWEATTKDNVTHVYGKSASARIADPSHPHRVFRWLLEESRDDRGNVILYQYKAENLDNVALALHESHRQRGLASFANAYLKRILYGNKTGVSSPSAATDFHFEVVFDYGEHDTDAPTTAEDVTWPARQDPLSSYRAGFEIRTYRLCRRVLMFHRGLGLTPDPRLVRSTDFTYSEQPTLTYLTRVEHAGYDHDGSDYSRSALPPVDFAYSPATLHKTVKPLDIASAQGLPIGVDGRSYQWVDLDGEGVAGVLTQQGSALYYKRNLGQGKLARDYQRLSDQPTSPRLGAQARARQQLLDVTGDGVPDLVDTSGPTPGYHARQEDGRWGPLRPFHTLPNIDWADPSIRFLDLDGDGAAEIVMSERDVYTWWPSLRQRGYGPPRQAPRFTDERRGPSVVFREAEQTVFLADMSGDGLTDLVRIRNGQICYWPNLGYGRFGPMVSMGGPRLAPPNLYDPSRVRLADIDGSGTTDLLYIGHDGVYLWLNQAGNTFGPKQKLASVPDYSSLSAVDIVDLLGTGTSCLVWSSPLRHVPRRMFYVDLMGGKKPHLLETITNNLGLETTLTYAPSTKFYLADRAAGIPWATRLPFPVHVVEKVEHYDRISKLRFASTYNYRHGYYDPEEREFRGFGYVEQRDAESIDEHLGQGHLPDLPASNGEYPLPPVVTKTWFHTGAWLKRHDLYERFSAEWYAGNPSEPRLSKPNVERDGELGQSALFEAHALSPTELHQAHRAFAGRMLRQEIYAEDSTEAEAKPYVVTQQTHRVRPL